MTAPLASCCGRGVRVSTDRQTVENQLRELRQIAEGRGGSGQEYDDAGISGSTGLG